MKLLERHARRKALAQLRLQPALLDADTASKLRGSIVALAFDPYLETCILAAEVTGANVLESVLNDRVQALILAKIGLTAGHRAELLHALADVVELAARRCSTAVQGRVDADEILTEARRELAASVPQRHTPAAVQPCDTHSMEV